jgi:hypothetical protein
MNKNLILGFLLLSGAVSMNAQVTIGSLKNPENFSVLELISNTGGLRLPQLTDDEKFDAFKEGNTANQLLLNNPITAPGLTIFNLTGKCVETWNGTEWIAVTPCVAGYALGEVAYRNSTSRDITGRLKFATYNLGADAGKSIKDQLLFVSSTYDDDPTSEEVALTANFKPVYGDLYQWGRKTDGHQNVWSSQTTTTVADPTNAGTANFITGSSDWTYVSDDDLWNGAEAANNPCVTMGVGWHVPSQDEWAGIIWGVTGASLSASNVGYGVNKWLWVDGTQTLAELGVESGNSELPKTKGYLVYPPASTYNFSDGYAEADYQTTPTLFLPAAGWRDGYYGDGHLSAASVGGYYWSSTIDAGGYPYFTDLNSGNVNPENYYNRADGLSVRCLSE